MYVTCNAIYLHLKTILAVTLFSRRARGSWLEDGVCCKIVFQRSEVHEIFMRIDMKHSYFSNYFITCLPSFFSIIKVIIELLFMFTHNFCSCYIETNLTLYMYLFIEIS